MAKVNTDRNIVTYSFIHSSNCNISTIYILMFTRMLTRWSEDEGFEETRNWRNSESQTWRFHNRPWRSWAAEWDWAPRRLRSPPPEEPNCQRRSPLQSSGTSQPAAASAPACRGDGAAVAGSLFYRFSLQILLRENPKMDSESQWEKGILYDSWGRW